MSTSMVFHVISMLVGFAVGSEVDAFSTAFDAATLTASPMSNQLGTSSDFMTSAKLTASLGLVCYRRPSPNPRGVCAKVDIPSEPSQAPTISSPVESTIYGTAQAGNELYMTPLSPTAAIVCGDSQLHALQVDEETGVLSVGTPVTTGRGRVTTAMTAVGDNTRAIVCQIAFTCTVSGSSYTSGCVACSIVTHDSTTNTLTVGAYLGMGTTSGNGHYPSSVTMLSATSALVTADWHVRGGIGWVMTVGATDSLSLLRGWSHVATYPYGDYPWPGFGTNSAYTYGRRICGVKIDDNNRVLLCWSAENVPGNTVCGVVDVSATPFTRGTELVLGNSYNWGMSMAAVGNGAAVACWRGVWGSTSVGLPCIALRAGSDNTLHPTVVPSSESISSVALAMAFTPQPDYMHLSSSSDSRAVLYCGSNAVEACAQIHLSASPSAPFPQLAGAGVSGDPHITFANGGKADFRGSHRASYIFLSSPGYQFAPYFQEVDFDYKGRSGRWQLVHGTFMTRALWRLRTAGGRELVIATDAMTPGEASVTALPDAMLALEPSEIMNLESQNVKPWRSVSFDDVRVSTRMLSVAVETPSWTVNVTSKVIYGLVQPLLNVTHVTGRWEEDQRRLDLSISGAFPQPDAHGIVGQSYQDATIRHGKLDEYAADANGPAALDGTSQALPPMTTSAQAEGAIEGVHTDYKLESIFSTDFKYSRYHHVRSKAPAAAAGRRIASATEREGGMWRKEL